MTRSVACECCGAEVRQGANCEYCGTLAPLAGRPVTDGKCATCGRPEFEGQNVCLFCGTISQLTTKLQKQIEKVGFSQNKYRLAFRPEVQAWFRPDEFVVADTYGPSEYYIATTARIIICEVVEIRNLFSDTRHPAGPKRAIDFDRITQISAIHEIEPATDLGKPSILGIVVETFDGDTTIKAAGSRQDGFYFKDPHYFSHRLRQALTAFEDERWLAEHILYKTGLEQSKAAQAAHVKPPAAEEPPVEAEIAEDFSHLTNKSNDEFLSDLGIDDVLQRPKRHSE